ncbi:amino acid ABC transporter substrate-binding protein, PAAT family [Alkalispirochaeta americana]|uniref:Amino acid ABC transporter substrate-binding protein, PAAT family n=1 Tax=Alkalispirochaeta americana TaxID=159291 RepID=A0A1N6ULD4_9SPIO|nr:amino acid ABC transporter [Alkalispirochaeta americana]SIQ66126.1 amino acid ABC transporter substrate-binding protein, PAAT family [Alkalispirochaeta americana]
MKDRIGRRFPRSPLLLLFLLLPPILVVSLPRDIHLTIAYENKEQPPYYMGNTEEVLPRFPGIAVEMVQALEEEIPRLRITLVRVPWSRNLAGLGNNSYDGIFNASYRKDRLHLGWYPTTDGRHQGPPDPDRRITTLRYSLYRRRDSSLRWDGEGLRGTPSALNALGAPLGYSIVQDMEQRGITVREVPGTTNALEMILLSRLEGAVLQDVTADALLAAEPERFRLIVKEEIPLEEKDYFLMLSHRFVQAHPGLAQQIWDTLGEIRRTRSEELHARYLPARATPD